MVEVGAHQLDVSPLRDIARKGHALGVLVDREHGPYDRLLVGSGGTQRQGIEKGACGEFRRALTQVLLVERECGLAIDLVEHVALRTRDTTLGAKEIPTALAAMPDPHSFAVEAHGLDALLGRHAVVEYPRALEARAIARQSARDDDVRG